MNPLFRKKSILLRTCIALCGTAFLQGVIVFGFTQAADTFDEMTINAYDILSERVAYRQKSLSTIFTENIDNKALFEQLNTSSIKALHPETNGLENDQEIADALLDILRSMKSSGAFIVLDKDKAQQSYYPSLYLRDIQPNSVVSNNADILALYGKGSLIKNLGIPFDPVWNVSMELDETNETSSFYFKPFREAEKHKEYTAYDLGYWSRPFRIQESDVEIITYTMPILDENHEVLGIMGLEFSCDYIRSLLTYDELNTSLNNAYSLSILDQTNATNLLVNGPTFTSIENKQSTLSSVNADTYSLYANEQDNIASIKSLNLYKPNTPFSNEQWVLMGVVQKESLLQNVYGLQKALNYSIIFSMFATLAVAIFLSYRFATPILSLSKRLKNAPSNGTIELPKIHIEEIDELSQSIIQLSQDVAFVSSRVSHVLDVMGIPIGVFAYDEHKNYVFCSEMVGHLLDFNEEAIQNSEITKEKFEQEAIALRSKVLIHKEEAFDEVKNQKTDLIYIQSRSGKRWLRFHQIEHEDELLVVINDVSKEMIEKQKLEEERDFDTLTSLLNRRAFRREMSKHLEDVTHIGAMVMWDLDNLKYINDTYGHDAGDRYIKAAASILSQLDPRNTLVARMAGDEFLAYIYGIEDISQIRKLIRKVHSDLLQYNLDLPDGTTHPIRASAGISWFPQDGITIDELLRQADFAMYDAKNTIKGSIREFSKETYLRDELLFSGKEELNTLIDEARVRFEYQPIVSALTGEVYGYEALMRPISNHIKTTVDLFRLAKAQSKQHQMERITWFCALKEYTTNMEHIKNHKLFINSQPNLSLHPVDIQELEQTYADFLQNIVIEIIESDDLDIEATRLKLDFCKKHGTQIAIDDFGSGYNNESILLKLTPQYIKIDMDIIHGIYKDEDRQQLVRYVVQFAHSKHALIIAEGIENFDDLKMCVSLGVDLLQGFYLALPNSIIQDIDDEKKQCIRNLQEK